MAFALVAAITPGPSNVILTTTGANVGIWRGIPCLLGVAGGMGLMILLVAFGMGSLVVGNVALLAALNWAGAAFLLWLSWKIATAPVGAAQAPRRPIGFVEAALFQWINPKSWIVSASAAGTYLQPGGGTAVSQAVLLGGLFLAAALPSSFAWLAFGAALQRVLSSPRRLRLFNTAMGLLLAGSVVLMLVPRANAS
ncbi:MAG TPA: LysE family translocator [Burkholderiales bacterium]|nr:LysE family translocator [Burkholderiales bacterium]